MMTPLVRWKFLRVFLVPLCLLAHAVLVVQYTSVTNLCLKLLYTPFDVRSHMFCQMAIDILGSNKVTNIYYEFYIYIYYIF